MFKQIKLLKKKTFVTTMKNRDLKQRRRRRQRKRGLKIAFLFFE